jgi:nucleoside-diphosphate-sugar epimerase
MAESTVLVTGAAGFIGRRLCAALADRARVRALVRAPVQGPWHDAVTGDITAGVDDDATAGIDTIFHLAARTHAVDERSDGDDERYRAVNVAGTRSLLESAARSGVGRVVFTSSIKAMGEGGDGVFTDASVPAPETAYGRTKLEAERLVLGGGYVGEAVVLRPCLIYGPGVKGNIERMLAAIDAGRFPPVPETGNRRSLVHVDDVVAALVAAADSPRLVGEAWIVSEERYYSTRDIYEVLCRALGRVARPGWPPWVFSGLARAGDVAGALLGRRAPFDSEARRKLFGSAAFDGSRLWAALESAPQWTLERAAPAIVAAHRGQ